MALADCKKSLPNLDEHFVQLARNGDVQKLKAEVDDVASIICAVDGDGWTMLHHAADAGRLEMVEFLLSGGADIDAGAEIGWTPLYFALPEDIEITKLLADRGAVLDAVTKDGKTPLDIGMKHPAVASFLANKMLNTLLSQRKVDDAIKFYEDMIELQKKSLGITLTLTTRTRMGEMMYDQCRDTDTIGSLLRLVTDFNLE